MASFKPEKAARKHNAIRSKMTREDGTVVSFRSRAEGRHADFLEIQRRAGLIRSWSYETSRWHFPNQKCGSCSYTADFTVVRPTEVPLGLPFRASRIVDVEEHHEIKGYWTSKDTEKLVKLARHFPEVVVQTFGAPMPPKARVRMEAARALTIREREAVARKAEKKGRAA